jgi:hypothetical protein
MTHVMRIGSCYEEPRQSLDTWRQSHDTWRQTLDTWRQSLDTWHQSRDSQFILIQCQMPFHTNSKKLIPDFFDIFSH